MEGSCIDLSKKDWKGIEAVQKWFSIGADLTLTNAEELKSYSPDDLKSLSKAISSIASSVCVTDEKGPLDSYQLESGQSVSRVRVDINNLKKLNSLFNLLSSQEHIIFEECRFELETEPKIINIVQHSGINKLTFLNCDINK